MIPNVASNSGDTVFRFHRSDILTLVSFPERTHSVFLWEATGQWIWQGESEKACVCGAQSRLSAGEVSYYERLLIDVVQIQWKDVIFAAHVHAIVGLVHAKDPIVGGVQQKGEVVSRASGLYLCRKERKRKWMAFSSCAKPGDSNPSCGHERRV